MKGNALKARIVLKGITVDEFVEEVKKNGARFSRGIYYNGLSGKTEYDRSQIQAMAEILNLTDGEIMDIFFKQ